MWACFKQTGRRAELAGFTLVEVLFSVAVLTLTIGGIIYGYVKANDFAEWSSMSLAGQSLASQGMEQARAAQWNSQQNPYTNGPGTEDELPPGPTGIGTTNYSLSGSNYAMDVPASGAPFYATNIITITTVQTNPPLRMIRSDCVWKFAAYGANRLFTNTMITYRAPDQ